MKSGIKTSTRLSCLRPVLREWININQRLGSRWQSDGDAPWWYNECALVSTFAGAVWLSKGYAFEEYSDTKRGKSKKGFRGRVDLEFSAGQHEFKAEVKQCWPAGRAKRDQTGYITGLMERAKQDVRRCPPGRDAAFSYRLRCSVSRTAPPWGDASSR